MQQQVAAPTIDASPAPPKPSELGHLRPSNLAGALCLGECVAITTIGFWLSLNGSVWIWAVGQIVLALSFVQWFAVLHECGHETMFRTKRLHAPLGQVAGFFSIIPFYNWKRVHAPPPQVDRLAGRRSHDGGARAARARNARTTARQRVLAVLDSVVLGALSQSTTSGIGLGCSSSFPSATIGGSSR